MERSMLDLWVGLFVCAGIGALLVLALKVGSMNGFSAADTYQVQAQFDNIGGLKRSAPVKSAGVVVGRVDDISFDNAYFPGACNNSHRQALCISERFFGIDPDRRFAGGAVHRHGWRG